MYVAASMLPRCPGARGYYTEVSYGNIFAALLRCDCDVRDELRGPDFAAFQIGAVQRLELGLREGMRRRPREQRLGPGFEPRIFVDDAERLYAIEVEITLQEWRICSVDQRIFGAVEERAGRALLLQRPLELAERRGNFLRRRLVRGFVRRIAGRGDRAGEGRHVIGPGTVDGALHRILGVQPRRDRLVQIFGDRARFEQRHGVVDAQHRHLLVRRDGEEPVRPVVRIDVPELERDVLFAQHDRGALHPRARLEAD